MYGNSTIHSISYYKIRTHLDGARLFNASIALGTPVSLLAKPFDSVQVCLSKGLAAPVGSILAGSREFIQSARKYRKMLGGGMRQVGVLAAAGIIAVTKMVNRLEIDHKNARDLANYLYKFKELKVGLENVQTNMIYITTNGLDATEIDKELKSLNILVDCIDRKTIRLVTHKDIKNSDIDIIVKQFEIAIWKLMKKE